MKSSRFLALILALFLVMALSGAVVASPFGDGGSMRHAADLGERKQPDTVNTAAPAATTAGPIIADHTVVDQYANIPQEYIDKVKKMWLDVPGESHSSGYRKGLQFRLIGICRGGDAGVPNLLGVQRGNPEQVRESGLPITAIPREPQFLMNLDSRFQVNVTESGAPEPYTDQHLRVSGALRSQYNSWEYEAGEREWYTNVTGTTRIKNHLTYANTNGLEIAAFGFGWCWDMTWHPTGWISIANGLDPVYNVHWDGSSVGGPDGNTRWGLDAGDVALTGNRITMDTYLSATQEYINHASTNSYPTKVFFTTGPVDGYSGESGYQRHLKHEYIRNNVRASSDRILFDYADILSWSNAGQQNLSSWTDYGGVSWQYQMIHADNMLNLDGTTHTEDGDHIGQRGALRLGKALWWMLARIAGWDGTSGATLTLHGTPADRMIYLTWEVSGTLPLTSTWQIEYINKPGTAAIPVASGLVSATRAYTLTNLTNNVWHTVTLSARLGGISFLSDTVSVMPAAQPPVVAPTLDLRGAPGDHSIHLTWEVSGTLPTTSTWQIEYYTQTLTAPFTATAPYSVTRSTVLTENVSNYQWYTVTLRAMDGATSILSDTVRVMPTDRFVYLPAVQR